MSAVDWKSRETGAAFRVPEGDYLIIRVDGWRFHSLTKELRFEKPFDERMMSCMIFAAREPLSLGLPVLFSFTFSDEISFLLKPPIPFKGRVEKLVSIFASLSACAFSSALHEIGLLARCSFDGRAIPIERKEIAGYLSHRQGETWRNCVNSYAQRALLLKGLSPAMVSRQLRGTGSSALKELIFRELGMNVAEVPAWQRRGVLVFAKSFKKTGIDAKTGQKVTVTRRRVIEEWNVPPFSSEEGRTLIEEILGR